MKPLSWNLTASALVAATAFSLLAVTAGRAETAAERSARMKWFNDARFGMFIHWGVYSQAGGNFKGKPVPGAGEWLQNGGQIPAAEYRAELLGQFNPVKYAPDAWVKAAKDAGMKYIVITSKHHDGFCLWDSKLTDWDVGSTPYKKDLLGPLAAACKKQGIRFCVYHSIMDWSHPDWGTKAPWRGNANTANPDMDRFTTYLKGQLKELVDLYQPGILWFDGEWEPAWTHERGADLYDYLRQLDPALIINNRVDKGRAGMQGHTTDAKFKGDYGTPEQEIPATGFGEGVAWESCMTMNNTWGFRTADTDWKSTETLVRNLIDIASKGGNYLLNVGPTGEGEIPAASLERLAAIGAWMKTNGESIHGTTASVFPKISWNGRSTTHRQADGRTRIYLHLFSRPADGQLVVRGLQNKPEAALILGQTAPLKVSGKAGAWAIALPATLPDPIATVVALTVAGEPVIQAPAVEPDAKGVLKLSAADANVHGAALRVEGDHLGFWTEPNDFPAWTANLAAGTYQVSIDASCEGNNASQMKLTVGPHELTFSFPATGSWQTFRSSDVGTFKIANAGPLQIKLQGVSKQAQGFLNLRALTLTPKP